MTAKPAAASLRDYLAKNFKELLDLPRTGPVPFRSIVLTNRATNLPSFVKLLKPAEGSDPGRVLEVQSLDADSAVTSYETAALVQHERKLLYVVSRPYAKVALEDELAVSDLSAEDAQSIAQRASTGLLSLHNLGLIHGDLRPTNVLKPSSKGREWSIVDYLPPGATIDYSDTLIPARHAAYIAPEVAAGSGPDQSSDVYAFGALLRSILRAQHHSHLGIGRRTRRALDALNEVSTVCMQDSRESRPNISQVDSAIRGELYPLLATLRDQRTLAEARRSAVRLIKADQRLGPALFPSKPLDEAIDRAMALVLESATTSISTSLWLQPTRNLHSVLSNITISILQGFDYNDSVVRRQLKISERNLNFGRRIEPPDPDDDWMTEIFDDFRVLAQDPPVPSHGSVESKADQIAKYSFSSEDTFDLLQAALSSASATRRLILGQPYHLLEDALEQIVTVGESRYTRAELVSAIDAGILLAVRDHGRILLPSFQFLASDQGLTPRPEVATVNSTFGPQKRGWSRALWWLSPHRMLNDRSPSDQLTTADPSRVVLAAQSDLELN